LIVAVAGFLYFIGMANVGDENAFYLYIIPSMIVMSIGKLLYGRIKDKKLPRKYIIRKQERKSS